MSFRFKAAPLIIIASWILQADEGFGRDTSSGSHWTVQGDALQLKADDGSVKKEVGLGSAEGTPSGNILKVTRDVRSIVTSDGKHALVIEKNWKLLTAEDAQRPVKVASATVFASFYDVAGNRLWQMPNVVTDQLRGPSIAKNGEVILLIQSSSAGCSTEEDLGCTERAVVMSNTGRKFAEFASSGVVSPVILSPEGKIALIGIQKGKRQNEIIIFKTANPGARKTFKELPGDPVLHDDGTVEFVKTIYGEPGSQGPVKLRSEVVKKIKL